MLRKLATTGALASLLISCAVSAQTVGTGAYPFASFDTPGFDSINLGNLNTRFSIPIVQKTGRGLPFSYILQYEGLVWTASAITGTSTWVPNSNWGFTGVLNGSAFSGYTTREEETETCATERDGKITLTYTKVIFSDFIFHDAFGANHPFTYTYTGPCTNGSSVATTSGSTTASDGSGYVLLGIGSGVQSRSGVTITTGTSSTSTSATSETDSNGNEINFGGSNGTFTDTLGTTPLTITGSGPVTFTYPVVNQSGGATTASANLYYKAYTVQTNFGCSGIVEYGATTTNLVDHITLADGSTYSFAYEATPGVAGAVTGRMASITLPTGGTISYAYSGGCSGAGINADGTPGNLSRTTSDSTNARTYDRSLINSNATSTTLTDQKGNPSVYTFTNYQGDFYETERQIYQGSQSGTPLLQRTTCYNTSSSSCNGVALTAQITSEEVTEQYNGGSQRVTANTFDTYGNLLTTSQSSGSTLLYTTTNTYNSLSELTSSETVDPNNNMISEATYGYDQTTPTATSGLPQHVSVSGTRGNQTSANVYYNGSSELSSTTAYYDTGMPVSTTTPNGTTSYAYDSTQTFMTQGNLPTPSSGVALSTSATYDAASGAILTSTGMNSGQIATVNAYDPRLRPTTITQPNGGQITASYSPAETNVTQSLNSSTGESSAESLLYDSYGRQSREAVLNGQSSNGYYQTDTCYDATGLVEFVATPYQSTGFNAAEHCSGAGTSYVRDALGRPTSITNSDGTTTIQYTNRAIETTDVNGIQKIIQYDVLGRITGVCEITSTALNGVSPTACGMDISGTGFVTSYAYVLSTHTTTVTQGAQTRTFVTDALGRTTSVTEPERGTTSYSYTYNSTGLQVVRTRPRANQTSATTYTHTTTQYDSIGRVVSISYDDGVTPTKSYYYDAVPSSLGWTQASTNPKGRLVATSSGSGTTLTESQYNYDVSGDVLSMLQCAPSICGGSSQQSRGLQFTYDLGGNLTYEADPASGGITYGRTPAGEISSVTSNNSSTGNPPNLVSSVVNTQFGPTSYALGNGINAVASYDTLGRNNGNWMCTGTTQSQCASGTTIWGESNNYKGAQLIGGCDDLLNQCQYNGYDSFNRLSSITDTTNYPGDVGGYTYTYDRWGNRLSQTSSSGGPSPSYSYNANNQLTSAAYDAAGNETGDGISHTYTYDAEGNVTAVDSGSTATYVYDALNHRVRVQNSSGTYEYLFDPFGHKTSMWLTSSNFGVEGRIYMGPKQIAFRAQDGTTYFVHKNWLGTERYRTNYVGQTVATEKSLPYGDGFVQTGTTYPDQDNDQYAGQDYDAESGTSHAQFRQYSSTQGRWMSPDPYDGSYSFYNPQSLNRYSYAKNNPLFAIDPSGLEEEAGTCDDPDIDCYDTGGGSGDGGGGGGDGDDGGGSPPVSDTCPTQDDYSACSSPDTGCNPQFDISCIAPSPNQGPTGNTSGPQGSAPNNTPTKSPCTQPILNAVNNQFGTSFNQNDVQGVPFDNGGGTNLNILGTNLPASQFNSLQTGRYPINWYTYLIGYGPTLHITGTTPSDPPPAFFGNSNIGGQTSILFTAHTDSSFAYNPIGFLIHVIIDIFHVGGPRKPCPV